MSLKSHFLKNKERIMLLARNRRKEFRKARFNFSRTSFMIGLGSVLGIGGNYFHQSYSIANSQSDKQALRDDWEDVGKDLWKVIDRSQK